VRRDLLTKMISGDEKAGLLPLSDDEITVEISNLVFAATDTTGTTLAYLFWELAQHPEWQTRLRNELEKVGLEDGVVKHMDVNDLEILGAVLSEGMRKNTVALSGLPRVVPRGGRNLDGVFVPEGVCRLIPPYLITLRFLSSQAG
jgi:cytochrome P450